MNCPTVKSDSLHMRGLLIVTLLIILITEAAFQMTIYRAPLWLSNNMVFFSLIDCVPYITLSIALSKGNGCNIGKGYKWFLLALATSLLILLLYLLIHKEITFNSMLFVYVFYGLVAPYVITLYQDYGLLTYFLPMVVLCVASLSCANNSLMKPVSLVSLLVVSISILLRYTTEWPMMNWPAVFIWISGLVWHSSRKGDYQSRLESL